MGICGSHMAYSTNERTQFKCWHLTHAPWHPLVTNGDEIFGPLTKQTHETSLISRILGQCSLLHIVNYNKVNLGGVFLLGHSFGVKYLKGLKGVILQHREIVKNLKLDLDTGCLLKISSRCFEGSMQKGLTRKYVNAKEMRPYP